MVNNNNKMKINNNKHNTLALYKLFKLEGKYKYTGDLFDQIGRKSVRVMTTRQEERL